jgi:hypothetical protein
MPDGAILNTDRSVSNYLYTIGSTLKGILWESTAVPELRIQEKNLAETMINQMKPEEHPATDGLNEIKSVKQPHTILYKT